MMIFAHDFCNQISSDIHLLRLCFLLLYAADACLSFRVKTDLLFCLVLVELSEVLVRFLSLRFFCRTATTKLHN